MYWLVNLQELRDKLNGVSTFVQDKVVDPISNEIEYGVNEFKKGNSAPVLNAITLGTSGAMAPLTQSVRGVDEAEGSLLETAGNYVEEKTGIPSVVTQVAAGVLIPGPGEYKAAGKGIARGVKKAFPLEGIRNLNIPGSPPKLALASQSLRQGGVIPDFNLAPQVMEARAKPGMTQKQWDSQRGEEIRIKRDKVEDSQAALENIEVNNPGISKADLKAEDTSGYKTHLRRKEDGQAKVSSAESNIVVPTADNPYAFPRNTPGAKQYKKEVTAANNALGRPIEQLDLHHLIPKGMSSSIYNRARDFIDKGLVEPDYLNRIAEKFKKITGADTGDLKSGIKPIRKPYHDAMHDEMRLQPSDTFPGESMEIMKDALTSKLTKIKNPKDFEIMLDNLIKNDIKPLVDNAQIWENMDDAIRSVSPSFTGRAKPNASLKKKKLTK